ncbi:MAG: hypothetical protein P4L31_06925 [Candidatus Babeliales bacterium]|nr:hypothetical protein [Candidatus Babeliales bacterium]
MNEKEKSVYEGYIVGFIGSLILVLVAHFFAIRINDFHFISEVGIQWIQSFSIVPIGAALYGQRGWDIQTWDGKSPQEKLNRDIFAVISAIGLFLSVLAFHLKP